MSSSSKVRWTSNSTPSAPLKIALSKAGIVFSGAFSISPVRAMTKGISYISLHTQ
ncbi:MAG: hypothetical protein ACFFB0_00020 [Promethearchaeota archaeon]